MILLQAILSVMPLNIERCQSDAVFNNFHLATEDHPTEFHSTEVIVTNIFNNSHMIKITKHLKRNKTMISLAITHHFGEYFQRRKVLCPCSLLALN